MEEFSLLKHSMFIKNDQKGKLSASGYFFKRFSLKRLRRWNIFPAALYQKPLHHLIFKPMKQLVQGIGIFWKFPPKCWYSRENPILQYWNIYTNNRRGKKFPEIGAYTKWNTIYKWVVGQYHLPSVIKRFSFIQLFLSFFYSLVLY